MPFAVLVVFATGEHEVTVVTVGVAAYEQVTAGPTHVPEVDWFW